MVKTIVIVSLFILLCFLIFYFFFFIYETGIWEGSGNVICLDVLRAMGREPESTKALFIELEKSYKIAEEIGENEYVATVRCIQKELTTSSNEELEVGARHLVDRLAICLAASVLLQDGDATVAKCFLRTRLLSTTSTVPNHNMGSVTGSILKSNDVDYLIDRLRLM
jgi:putative acyl-CoA dehydrogenase